jgi:hypothetical protein
MKQHDKNWSNFHAKQLFKKLLWENWEMAFYGYEKTELPNKAFWRIFPLLI